MAFTNCGAKVMALCLSVREYFILVNSSILEDSNDVNEKFETLNVKGQKLKMIFVFQVDAKACNARGTTPKVI